MTNQSSVACCCPLFSALLISPLPCRGGWKCIEKVKIQRQTQTLLRQLGGLFIISNDIMYSTVRSCYNRRIWNCKQWEWPNAFQKSPYLSSVWPGTGADLTRPCLPCCRFVFNTCHLIVLSLSYLHRHSWLAFITSRDTFFFLSIFYYF